MQTHAVRLVLTVDAEADLVEAYDWYETQRRGSLEGGWSRPRVACAARGAHRLDPPASPGPSGIQVSGAALSLHEAVEAVEPVVARAS